MGHEDLQDVERDAGVGAELGVGVPEGVGEHPCRVEGLAVFVGYGELVEPGLKPVADCAAAVRSLAECVGTGAARGGEQQHAGGAGPAVFVEQVRGFVPQVVLLAGDDLGVAGMEREFVPPADFLHPVGEEGVGPAAHRPVRVLHVDVVPLEAVEFQVAELPGPPAHTHGQLDVVAAGTGRQQGEIAFVHELEEDLFGQGVLGAALQLVGRVVPFRVRRHVHLQQMDVRRMVVREPCPAVFEDLTQYLDQLVVAYRCDQQRPGASAGWQEALGDDLPYRVVVVEELVVAGVAGSVRQPAQVGGHAVPAYVARPSAFAGQGAKEHREPPGRVADGHQSCRGGAGGGEA